MATPCDRYEHHRESMTNMLQPPPQALSVNPYFSIFGFYMFEYDRTHTTSIGPPCHVWSVTTSCAQIYKPSSSNNSQHLALNLPADTTDFPTFKSNLHVPDCTGVPEKFRFTQSLKDKLTNEHNEIPLHMFEMGTNVKTNKALLTSSFHDKLIIIIISK